MDHKKVIIEELEEALKICLKPLCNPEVHPWKDRGGIRLGVNLTVLAYTPQFKKQVSILVLNLKSKIVTFSVQHILHEQQSNVVSLLSVQRFCTTHHL